MKLNLTLIAIIAALTVFSVTSVNTCNQHKSAKLRLANNQNILLADIEHYKFRDSLNAVSVGILTMKANEVEKYLKDMTEKVKDMGVKLKRVESISQTVLEGNYHLQSPVRDTLVVIAADTSKTVPAQAISYKSPHIRLDGIIADRQFYGDIITRDTLFQVIHRVPRRFLFIKYGIKELRQEITNSNPHSDIIYNRTLRVE